MEECGRFKKVHSQYHVGVRKAVLVINHSNVLDMLFTTRFKKKGSHFIHMTDG